MYMYVYVYACIYTVLTSHNDTVLSTEHVINVLLYGTKCVLLTESVWPLRVNRHLRLLRETDNITNNLENV